MRQKNKHKLTGISPPYCERFFPSLLFSFARLCSPPVLSEVNVIMLINVYYVIRHTNKFTENPVKPIYCHQLWIIYLQIDRNIGGIMDSNAKMKYTLYSTFQSSFFHTYYIHYNNRICSRADESIESEITCLTALAIHSLGCSV